jgi:hypothetical protein
MHEKGAWWELEQLILMEKMRAKIDARYKERRKMADCNPDIRLKPGTATYTDLRRSTKGSQREQVKADKDILGDLWTRSLKERKVPSKKIRDSCNRYLEACDAWEKAHPGEELQD